MQKKQLIILILGLNIAHFSINVHCFTSQVAYKICKAKMVMVLTLLPIMNDGGGAWVGGAVEGVKKSN